MIDLTIDEDVVLDLWGRLDGVKILMAGNQWFVVPELLRLLEAEGVRAFVATLPPTAVLKMALGEEVKIGNLALAVKPDVISLPPSDMEALRGSLIEPFQYAENEIVVAYRGRPVEGWCGLAEVKAAIPSPELEGIGRLFKEVYEEVCGGYEALRSRSYVTKIHHREMPRLLKRGEVEAAVMWSTEAAYWGFPHTRPEPAKRGRLELGLASEAGRRAYEAFKRPEVEALYKRYGFKWLR